MPQHNRCFHVIKAVKLATRRSAEGAKTEDVKALKDAMAGKFEAKEDPTDDDKSDASGKASSTSSSKSSSQSSKSSSSESSPKKNKGKKRKKESTDSSDKGDDEDHDGEDKDAEANHDDGEGHAPSEDGSEANDAMAPPPGPLGHLHHQPQGGSKKLCTFV